MTRHYECECSNCGKKRQLAFHEEPFPEIGEAFLFMCPICDTETEHTRVLTKKAAAELRRKQQEKDLQNAIIDQCTKFGFAYRFVYRSVIITTALSDWCFDYHQSKITLYHESTVKVNFSTMDYAKSHVQFENKKMTPFEVIEYIAKHDEWRMNNGGKDSV